MSMDAVLTAGWEPAPTGAEDARVIVGLADEAGDEAEVVVAEHLKTAANGHKEVVIGNTEALFRRRPGGERPIRRLAEVIDRAAKRPELTEVKIHCGVDVFTYAFLTATRSFDRAIPELRDDPNNEFRDEVEPKLMRELRALEAFERDGTVTESVRPEAYLALRSRVAPRGAFDERRVLATLLVSGPSTPTEITEELGGERWRLERILADFDSIGVTRRRERTGADELEHLIRFGSLGRVVFCLRETMGLDLLRFVS